MISESKAFFQDAGFELLGSALGKDVEAALKTALRGGVVFKEGSNPLSIFRQALKSSTYTIQKDKRDKLFQEFLRKGPCEDSERIPAKLAGKRLSDEETAKVITFIYSFMVNTFQGAVTELLAAEVCFKLLRMLQREGELPARTRLFVGDAVGLPRKKGRGTLKGADLHILIGGGESGPARTVTVAGVGEVKSYFPSKSGIRRQIRKHIRRLKNGLQIDGVDYFAEQVRVGFGDKKRVLKIRVVPDDWRLPRTFHFEKSVQGRALQVDPGIPKLEDSKIKKTGRDSWLITLRWSKEALAEAAYEMTFWYMEKVGEVIYKSKNDLPKNWSEMTPAQAGRNAAKMMLYYAILRCRTVLEQQRAIALYNSYGFGYALGMNFKNADRKREMLWPKDLDEILLDGKTKNGCSLRQ